MSDNTGGPEQSPSKNDSRDEIIRKRSFSRARGIDISSFMVGDNNKDEAANVIDEVEVTPDIAMGEIAEIFSKGGEDFKRPGAIQKDGTVNTAPENDSVTDLAVHGEKRLGFGLLIAMILSWSLIGTIVGTVLDPIFGAIGLSLMAIIGLYLGEKWIPNPNMRILGVTWVIISMKLIYGLILDLWHWGWLDEFSFADENDILGALLLVGVVLNIAIAQRHDEDAIAAQATLILLIVGSAAGAVYGEFGVAIMIGIGTILLHSLAIIRNSGNLASMGIAVSYLWVGVHAISDNWNFFGLEVLPFEDELLLKYGHSLKKLKRRQGRILIRLIDRETGRTSYNIIKDFRNVFSAGFWQLTARLFGHDLRSVYNENKGEDVFIEYIIKKIERESNKISFRTYDLFFKKNNRNF